MSESPRDVIGKALPKSWSQDKRDNVADEIEAALSEAGLLFEDEPEVIGIRSTHVPIEEVEAYGLVLAIDANGYAAEISSPLGLEIVA